jgi:hypothetical protein
MKKRVYRKRALSTKPRPLVGTKTWIKQKELDMRDQECSDAIDQFMRALAANKREKMKQSGTIPDHAET